MGGGGGGGGIWGGLLAEKLQRGVEQRRPGIGDQLSHHINNVITGVHRFYWRK